MAILVCDANDWNNKDKAMALILKSGVVVGRYAITEELNRGTFVTAYQATMGGGSVGECELRQYKTPSPELDWFDAYVNYHRRLKDKFASDPKLQSVCEESIDLFTGVDIDGRIHDELFRVTPPTPTRLAELLEANELTSVDRFALAQRIAAALVVFHQSGLVLVDLSPSSIGVREDGSPVFLDIDWARFSGETAPWDGHQGDVTAPDYCPPELNEGKTPTTAADIYSLGRLLVELLMETKPVNLEDNRDQADLDVTMTYRDDLPDFDRSAVNAILRACLDKNPGDRPTAERVAAVLGGQAAIPHGAARILLLVPRWLKQSLQTLAFWVAYQNEVYRHHLLPEGAIVAELTRLIDASISSDKTVIREPLYRNLLLEGSGKWKLAARADLAVKTRCSNATLSFYETIIEVKRAKASADEINGDLIALAQLRAFNPQVRAFLVVVEQASLPIRWVGPNGIATPETESLSVTLETGELLEVRYRVRRVAKAAASFKSMNKATYCCLIEVL